MIRDVEALFDFFEPLDARVFYEAARSSGDILAAIRTATRPGYQTEAFQDGDEVILRYKMEGDELWKEVRVRGLPRAWAWWDPPEERLSYVVYGEDEEPIFGPMLGNLDVFCDLCNVRLLIRPVPVFLGSYALCRKCFQSVIGIPLEEAAEMDGVSLHEIQLEE